MHAALAMENLNKMKQLEATIETLQKEKVELLQRIRGAEECLRSISQEKSYLNILVADLQSDRDITNRNMAGLSKTIEKTVAANLELQERLRATTGFTKGCREILQEAKAITFADKSTQLSDSQEGQDQATKEANQKVEQLTAELNLQISEKEQLLADNKWRKENLQQVVTDNAYLKKVMAAFWDTVSSLKMENECLREKLMTVIDKEMAARLTIMEKKKKYIEKVSLNLKGELDRMKTVTARSIPRLLPANATLVKRLQTTYDQTSFSACCLLDEIKYYFSVWFKDSNDYYVNLSSFSTDLLRENVRHLKLAMETPSLKKTDQWCEKFKVSKIPALRRKLDEVLEIILQDVSNLEQELLAIEAKVRELECGKKERKIYMDNCAIIFHVQDFERGIRNDTRVLQAFLEVLKSKSKALTKARSEVVAKHACICWEVEAVLLSCRETPEQQPQEQEMPKDLGAEASGAHEVDEEEEAKKLEHNLSTVEQDMTAQLDDAAAALEKEELDPLTALNANSSAD